MRKLLVSLFMSVSIAGVHADDLTLKNGYPQTYTVKKGDTLWAISGKFLKQPWRWPELWNLNKSDIKNPHWIYPGDLITLDFVNGKPRLSRSRGAKMSGGIVKLSPQVRVEGMDKDAIPAIPSSVIDPFLTQPKVIEEDELKDSPRVAGGAEGRLSYGQFDYIYATGLANAKEGSIWQIYRQGKEMENPDEDAEDSDLGFEAIYAADARLDVPGEVSKLTIVKAEREVSQSDRLTPAPQAELRNYVPHPVEPGFSARVVKTYADMAEGAQYYMVVINKGTSSGMEVGHVMKVFNAGRKILKEDKKEPDLLTLPEEAGTLMVFKTFEKISYALVMESSRPIKDGDILGAP
ncbi:LysM peptidoglycan-binding domain-containing protein [Leeia sp. TBRC 13508]|uniref:LysM peptidoglycan-binding domain-containing protein n=1 Tax=Leeia speluncae TaxID=2884804 RepID=A0ABS8D6T6_9NEIS|nr:LysM peptidoglycan-binding domain-containing protein [Leeia speluncae]MCB6183908.1 LysM peptidoglycan-binding domain-containing protein [Leeia speluncae]